ncbi:hypothetical protein GW17_00058490, partial [Ensete ventricosum]
VGTFRIGRTLNGKKQPPSCKEGDMIKEGQAIGFLDQFGNELPVRVIQCSWRSPKDPMQGWR